MAVDIDYNKLSMYQNNFPNVTALLWELKVNAIDETNKRNNIPADAVAMLDTIVRLGIERLRLGEKAVKAWERQHKAEGTGLPPRGSFPFTFTGPRPAPT